MSYNLVRPILFIIKFSVVISCIVEGFQWTQAPFMNAVRMYHSVANVQNDTFYVFGGCNQEQSESTVESFTPGKSWQIIGKMPRPRCASAAVAVEDNICIFI